MTRSLIYIYREEARQITVFMDDQTGRFSVETNMMEVFHVYPEDMEIKVQTPPPIMIAAYLIQMLYPETTGFFKDKSPLDLIKGQDDDYPIME